MPRTRKSRRRVKNKKLGRAYNDITPKAPKHNGRGYGAQPIGKMATGFDAYGYPVIKDFRLPAPFTRVRSRVYGQTGGQIQPMKIATIESIAKPKVAIAQVFSAKTKPSPNVPAAPKNLPGQYEFCVTEGKEGWFARYRDPNHPRHGSEVAIVECNEDQGGMMICDVVFMGRQYGQTIGGSASGSASGSGSWEWGTGGEWSGEWSGSAGGSAGGDGGGSGGGKTPRPNEPEPTPQPRPRPEQQPQPSTPVGLTRTIVKAPICDEPGADKEPMDPECCVKLLGDESGQVVCAGSAYDGLVVKIVTVWDQAGVPFASIEHPDLPGGGHRIPVCEPVEEIPEERPCCVEEETGMIVCPEGIDFPLAGQKIPLEFLEFVDNADGMRVARLRCGDIAEIEPSMRAQIPELDAMYMICEELGGYVFAVCERPPKLPPERPPEIPPETPPEIPKFPDICCYDPSTGRLVCEGTPYHDLPVAVIGEANVDGRPIVSVQSDRIPGGGARVPVCPPPKDVPTPMPKECCVVESTAGLTLVCKPQEHPYNGLDVTDMAKCYDSPEGRMCVVTFVDANGRSTTIEAPACPPPETKIPPPETGEIPPAPDPEYIPVPPSPRLPPESVPTKPPRTECSPEEWDKMVNAPKKLTKCDKKWMKMMKMFRENMGQVRPGRRYSGLLMHGKPKIRRYAYGGISPEHLENSTSPQFTKKRFPGLRGGRKTI